MERKRIDRPEVIGVARGGEARLFLIEMPPIIKIMTTKPITFSVINNNNNDLGGPIFLNSKICQSI